MRADIRVRIPIDRGRIVRKKVGDATYIYYKTGSEYDPDKKYSIPKSTPTIGRMCDDDPDMMIPNDKYLVFYPDADLPEEKWDMSRSACLRTGAYIVFKKLFEDAGMDGMINDIMGADGGLFMDLCSYSIITESNAGQYYPDYAYNHPLFTPGMRSYSDSKVSTFINGITKEQGREFIDRWVSACNRGDKVYISYDSTNKNCQAGDIEIAEFGHAKNDDGKPVINYSMGYDVANGEPLFYEAYLGSIVDVSQLQYMLEKAKGYGFKKIGFILDRGYFSEANIRYMDKNGYEFIIMMKGMKKLVSSLVLSHKGTFEESRACSIREFGVSGMTVKDKLFETDEKDRYFHIYFDEGKRTGERSRLEEKIDRMSDILKEHEGKQYELPSGINKYFEAFHHTEGKTRTFTWARERTQIIDREIKLCGYFVIITSEKMTAKEAISRYKDRDGSEKLFRGDKSYLGNRSYRTYTRESTENKIFIEFVALIIRHHFFRKLKEQEKKNGKRENYMTVPKAINELEKIEMVRLPDGNYKLDHAVSKTQKEILKSFGMTEKYIREQVININRMLQGMEV